MNLEVYHSVGEPHLMVKPEGKRFGTVFDLVLPIDIHNQLIDVCARHVYWNGSDEQKDEFKKLIAAWAEMTIEDMHRLKTVMANVDNDKLSDAEFRQFVRSFNVLGPT